MVKEFLNKLSDTRLLLRLFSAEEFLFTNNSDGENLEICNRIFKIFKNKNIATYIEDINNFYKNKNKIINLDYLTQLLEMKLDKNIVNYFVRLIINYKIKYEFNKSCSTIFDLPYDLFVIFYILFSYDRETFNFFVEKRITLEVFSYYEYIKNINAKSNASTRQVEENEITIYTTGASDQQYLTTLEPYWQYSTTDSYIKYSYSNYGNYREVFDSYPKDDCEKVWKILRLINMFPKMYPFYYEDDIYTIYYPKFDIVKLENYISEMFSWFSLVMYRYDYGTYGVYKNFTNTDFQEIECINVDKNNPYYLYFLRLWCESQCINTITNFDNSEICKRLIYEILYLKNIKELITKMESILCGLCDIVIKCSLSDPIFNADSLFNANIREILIIFENFIKSKDYKLNEDDVLKLKYIMETFYLKELEFNEQMYENLRNKSLEDIKEITETLDKV